MSLSPASRLGPYEIVGKLGAGGMGEVYRARDTRLHRLVAIKVLPAAFAHDAERLARFRREAQVLAALNHSNIAAIYGLEEADWAGGSGSAGVIALAMEYVEGEDLAERLRRGALGPDEAIAVARQIADALEAAHEKGIVHRDLKPANVRLMSDGKIKVLDFGLAKAVEAQASVASPLSQSPTVTTGQGTEAGVILGTAAYMSPEQARGKTVDKRADIWSFGVVLHEMLTGRRLFEGETVSDVLAAVLTREVDWSALPAGTPPRVTALLRRCLERDPRQRLRDIGEARVTLSRPTDDVPLAQREGRAAAGRVRIAFAAALGLVAGVLATAAYLRGASSATPAPAARLAFELPAGVAFDAGENDSIAVSPNGRLIVFTGRTADGKRQLWLRPLDSLDARPLFGTEEALEPFWSPDSRSIGFGSQGRLKRIDIGGGRPSVLADAPRLVGGTWNGDGVIVFGPDYNRGLLRVPAGGGDVASVIEPDTARGETSLRVPSFLPDDRHFVFVGGRSEERQVLLGSLDGSRATPLASGTRAHFAAPGHLLVAAGGALLAYPFDARRRIVTGDPVMVPGTGGQARPDTSSSQSVFSVSTNRVLVWQRFHEPRQQLVWFDRQGRRLGTVGDPIKAAAPIAPRLSPDERSLTFQNREDREDRRGVYALDIERGVATRLSAFLAQYPQWSPDGRRVAWTGGAGRGVVGIYSRAANGVGEPELLLKASPEAGGTPFIEDWPSDRMILYRARGAKSRLDIWAVDPSSRDRRPQAALASEFDEQYAQLSPNGRWIAFVSDLSGTLEVYLQSMGADRVAGSERVRVSPAGGAQPRFRRDGRELFYMAPDGKLMAAALAERSGVLQAEPSRGLFQARSLPPGASLGWEYDVTRDGQRFLIGTVLDGPDANPPLPLVMLDWAREAGVTAR